MKRMTLILLAVIVLGSAAAFVVCPKQAYSASERRRLAGAPKVSADALLDGSYTGALETYLLDHFPMREAYRGMKAHFAVSVLRQNENNGIYIADGHASKLEYPLNEAGVERAVQLVRSLKETHFPDNRVFYTVIPDKNYFLAAENGYPSMDYEKLSALLSEGIAGEAQYIDIASALTIDDYYRTDAHWRQERLGDVVECLFAGLGCAQTRFDIGAYTQHTIADFNGVYRGQAALPFPAEEIVYLTNETTDNAEVYDVESDSVKAVYQTQLLSDEKSLDAYDIYLGGARAVLIMKNGRGVSGDGDLRRLIVFRDSFGSSLAPLLLEQYDEVVLVDLRYISASLIDRYVDFENADVLFAYNTLIWNNASILKK